MQFLFLIGRFLARLAKGHVSFRRRTSQNFTFKSSPLKPLNQIKANLAGMFPGWVPFKIVSRQPRPPFKIAAVTKNINFFNCPILTAATWQGVV
jgi:hypothetical protein